MNKEDPFREVRSVDGNIQAYLHENNKLVWECSACGKELDGLDPEGELCVDCYNKKKEE